MFCYHHFHQQNRNTLFNFIENSFGMQKKRIELVSEAPPQKILTKMKKLCGR